MIIAGMDVKKGFRFVSKHMRNVDGSELVMVVTATRRSFGGVVYYQTEVGGSKWYADVAKFPDCVGRAL